MSNLAERLDKEPEVWKPEPGDKLVGTVLGIEERESEFGDYPVVTVDTDDGSEVVWLAFHTVAAREIKELAPNRGDEIAVKYKGEAETASGVRYNAYRVLVDPGPAPEPDPDDPVGEQF